MIKLSKRQVTILGLLNDGQSNGRIAETLAISEHTVKVHMWRLFRRVNVASRLEAAKWWRENRAQYIPEETTEQRMAAVLIGFIDGMDTEINKARRALEMLEAA